MKIINKINGSIYWSPTKCFDGLEFFDKLIPRMLRWVEVSRTETESGYVVYRYEAEVSEAEWYAVNMAAARILREHMQGIL